jgi:non-ribosomal peptide synthetase component E (peptide arylation enzyme)
VHTDEQVLEVLLDQFRVTQEQVSDAHERHPGAPVINALLETGAVQPRDVHEAIAASRPDAECLVFRDRRFTWAEITDRTRRLANHLLGQGLGAQRHGGVRPQPGDLRA